MPVTRRVVRLLQRITVNLRRGQNSIYERLIDKGRLQLLLVDMTQILVLDADCYNLQRGVVFKGRLLEDFLQ